MTNVLAIGPKRLLRRVSAILRSDSSIAVSACSSPRALARVLKRRKFQLALADWETTGRDGVALLAHAQIPLILISDPKHLAEAYRLAKSAEIVLETPVKTEELAALIAALLKGDALPHQATAPEKESAQDELPQEKSAAAKEKEKPKQKSATAAQGAGR